MVAADPYGRAVRDYYRGEQSQPLIHRDGPESREHPTERFYFGEFPDDADDESAAWLESRLDGPLLDAGAGAGRHALYFQDRFETVAVDVSEHLVETMRDRGVDDARRVDMFELRERFARDRFASVLVQGTQMGLAGSMRGLRRFLGALAFVTDADGTAVLDCYDPNAAETSDLIGYRHDPTPGLAYRVLTFEYEGDVSETLLFRLFSPDRVREAADGTGWSVEALSRDADENGRYYRVALEKK